MSSLLLFVNTELLMPSSSRSMHFKASFPTPWKNWSWYLLHKTVFFSILGSIVSNTLSLYHQQLQYSANTDHEMLNVVFILAVMENLTTTTSFFNSDSYIKICEVIIHRQGHFTVVFIK